MTFLAQLHEDMAHMLDTDVFAETVTYNGAAISAVIIIKESAQVEGKHNKMVDTAEAFVRVADVAEPAYRDTIVADGRTWNVAKTLDSDTAGHRLALESPRRRPA